jgi:hypothetical protein
MSAPMAQMGEDPSVREGQQVREQFTASAQAIRQNASLTDLQVAEKVVETWTSCNAQLARLYDDLQSRRRARLADLEKTVPLGPAIPADASQADVAVLQQAFRTALAQARAAAPSQAGDPSLPPIQTDHATLDAMLADAERFDDDNLRRAVLTASYEGGYMSLVRNWTDMKGLTAQLDEFAELQQAIAGLGIYGQWNFTTFSPIPAPSEVAALPGLQRAHEAAARVRAAYSSQRPVGGF